MAENRLGSARLLNNPVPSSSCNHLSITKKNKNFSSNFSISIQTLDQKDGTRFESTNVRKKIFFLLCFFTFNKSKRQLSHLPRSNLENKFSKRSSPESQVYSYIIIIINIIIINININININILK